MQTPNFEEVLSKIVERDPRYHRDAYIFLREALDHTQRAVTKGTKGETRHVTGQELIEGIREFALAQFGPMALTLLNEWGIRKTDDFGELVFNLIDQGLLSKTETDSRADFQNGYDFETAFRKPFLPSRPAVPTPVEAPDVDLPLT